MKEQEMGTSVFIQWKGTHVCLDFYCVCGSVGHYDGDFAYSLRCMDCERLWKMPHTFVLAEATPKEAEELVIRVPDPD